MKKPADDVDVERQGQRHAFLSSEYDRHDPMLFGFVSLALFLVAWFASYIPARRATRINPVEALRND